MKPLADQVGGVVIRATKVVYAGSRQSADLFDVGVVGTFEPGDASPVDLRA
jgi:hypothetical protein